MVAILKVGSGLDPRAITDMTLTAYRDAIDYLTYFRQRSGSLIYDIGSQDDYCKARGYRTGKIKGVCINCLGDHKGDPGRHFVQVEVPKMHPLFSLGWKCSDPLEIPEALDHSWDVQKYTGSNGSEVGDDDDAYLNQNPLARYLLLHVTEDDEAWGAIEKRKIEFASGSILVVGRLWKDLGRDTVQEVCKYIEQSVMPLVAEYRNNHKLGRTKVLQSIMAHKFGRSV